MSTFTDKRILPTCLLRFCETGIYVASAGYIASGLMGSYTPHILPYYYFAQAVFLFLVMVLSARMIQENLQGYSYAFFISIFSVLTISYILIISGFSWAVFVTCIILPIAALQLFIILGNSISLAFDIREFRRLENRLVSVVGVAGGFFALLYPFLISVFGREILIVISLFLYPCCQFLSMQIKPLPQSVTKVDERISTIMPTFFRPLILYATISMVILVLVNYLFLVMLKQSFDKAIIGSIATAVSGSIYTLMIFIQYYGLGWFMPRYGVTAALLLFPGCIILFGLVAIMFPGVASIIMIYIVSLVIYDGVCAVSYETILNTIAEKLRHSARLKVRLIASIFGRAVIATAILFSLGEEYGSVRNIIFITIVFGFLAISLVRRIHEGYRENLKRHVEKTRYFYYEPHGSIIHDLSDAKTIAMRALKSEIEETTRKSIENALYVESQKIILLVRALQGKLSEPVRLEIESRHKIAIRRFLYLFAAISDTRAVLNTMPKIQDQIFVKSTRVERANAIEYLDELSEINSLRTLLQETIEHKYDPITPHEYVALVSQDDWLTRIHLIDIFIPGVNMSTNEKILFLRRVRLYESLPAETLEIISQFLVETTVKANQNIFLYGEIADRIFMVVSGTVDIIIDNRIVNEFNQYELFGELGLLDDMPRSATAVAKTDVVLYSIYKVEFNQLLEDIPALSKEVIHQILGYLRACLNRQGDGNGRA